MTFPLSYRNASVHPTPTGSIPLQYTVPWDSLGLHQKRNLIEKLTVARGGRPPSQADIDRYLRQRASTNKSLILANSLPGTLWLSTPLFRFLVQCRSMHGFEILHFVQCNTGNALRTYFQGLLRKRAALKALKEQTPAVIRTCNLIKITLNSSFGFFRLKKSSFTTTHIWSEHTFTRKMRDKVKLLETELRNILHSPPKDDVLDMTRMEAHRWEDYQASLQRIRSMSEADRAMWRGLYQETITTFREWRRAQFLGKCSGSNTRRASGHPDQHPDQHPDPGASRPPSRVDTQVLRPGILPTGRIELPAGEFGV